ncbi:sarcosine oxidase subunit delta [Novosphingobium sp.]|uniref:sarcosine oxidase subunit delta n=1 Tax=Novosphingobium sp. TaxID=1874826 RepID=UPI003B52DE61
MRIPCPFCGPRDSREFTYRGDATPVRPPIATGGGENADEMSDYIHLRDNPAGAFEELWYHTQGCRKWLRVERNTRTHAVGAARFAHPEHTV